MKEEEKKIKPLKEFSKMNLTFSFEKSVWERSDSFNLLDSGSLMRIADSLEEGNRSNKELITILIEQNKFFMRKIDSINTKLTMLKARVSKLEKK